MEPITTLLAAKMGLNLLQSIAGGGGLPGGQSAQQAQQAQQAKMLQAAKFEQLLNRIVSSPEVQKAAVLAAEDVRSPEQASQRLGDFAARVMQDPSVQSAIAGNSGPVEMRFLPGGTVEIKTSDGRQRTIRLEGDAKDAAERASRLLDSMQPGGAPSSSGGLRRGPGGQGANYHGIRYTPGTGTALVLS